MSEEDFEKDVPFICVHPCFHRDMPADIHHATIASLNRCSKSSALAGRGGEFGDAVLGKGAFDEGGDVAFGESDC